jgi:anti-sigma factor RsiW
MLPGEREVGGLRCSEVLARLSDYMDGELDADGAAAVAVHVAGCDACARFGAGFAAAIAVLRDELGVPAALEPDVEGRLRARLVLPAR